MKREKCIICHYSSGKRVCKINNNALVCPICCAKTRHSVCEGCAFYTLSESPFSKASPKPDDMPDYIIELNPEIDEQVDDALARIEAGEFDDPKKIIENLLIKNPRYHTTLYAMGVVHLMQNKLDDAILYFEKAIKIFPAFEEAWFNKGAAHQKKLEVIKMIEAFQKVVALGEPKEPHVKQANKVLRGLAKQIRRESGISLNTYCEAGLLFERSFEKMQNQLYEPAIDGFQQVIKINPAHYQSYGNLGICLAIIGRKQEALNALDQALRINPGYEPAIINRQNLLNLKDDQTSGNKKIIDIDYSKDYSAKDRSLIRDLYDKSSDE